MGSDRYLEGDWDNTWRYETTTEYDLGALVDRVNRLTRDTAELVDENSKLWKRVLRLEQATGLNVNEFKPRVEALRSEDV